jgi:hypothetical protein
VIAVFHACVLHDQSRQSGRWGPAPVRSGYVESE